MGKLSIFLTTHKFSPTAEQVAGRIRILQIELCGDVQSELARRVGLHQRDISRYVNGKHMPSPQHLAAIAIGCDVSVDWLLGLTEVRRPISGIPPACCDGEASE